MDKMREVSQVCNWHGRKITRAQGSEKLFHVTWLNWITSEAGSMDLRRSDAIVT